MLKLDMETQNTGRQQKEDNFYLRLRVQVNGYLEDPVHRKNAWMEFALLAPDLFYLMVQLTRDKRVPRIQKAKLGGAILYFLSPIDLLPEAILGPIGYLDDVAVAAFALHSVLNKVDPEIVKEHWLGQGDLLQAVQAIAKRAHRFLGFRLWSRLKRRARKS